MNRRKFLQSSAGFAGAVAVAPLMGSMFPFQVVPKISLAQWSLHRAYEAGDLDPKEFPRITKERFGINAVEYVASFYQNKAQDVKFWRALKRQADDLDVKNLLIMVDGEGDLGADRPGPRMQAIQNHYKWVDAAEMLDCHSIRVNAFGSDQLASIRLALTDSLGKLCDYAAERNISILIENHGLFSSNAAFIAEVIRSVNRPNMGTLPDFGNWCQSVKWGGISDGNCENEYDKYQGVAEFMPFAKGVSAKSYDFDEEGNQPLIDYSKMMSIVKAAQFDGFIGIEYEGNNLSEYDGIEATKSLILKSWGS